MPSSNRLPSRRHIILRPAPDHSLRYRLTAPGPIQSSHSPTQRAKAPGRHENINSIRGCVYPVTDGPFQSLTSRERSPATRPGAVKGDGREKGRQNYNANPTRRHTPYHGQLDAACFQPCPPLSLFCCSLSCVSPLVSSLSLSYFCLFPIAGSILLPVGDQTLTLLLSRNDTPARYPRQMSKEKKTRWQERGNK